MANPRSSHIPQGMLLEHLAKVPILKAMVLITEMFSCPAYNLYFSSGSEFPLYLPFTLLLKQMSNTLLTEFVRLILDVYCFSAGIKAEVMQFRSLPLQDSFA